jgi:hypothetical protein
VPAAFNLGLLLESPLLSPGDRMGRKEFLERWQQMPGLKFAELIEGVVYMPSPLSLRHGGRDNLIQGLLFYYASRVPGCEPLTNATCLMTRNSVPQPDASLRWLLESGGRSRTEGGLLAGVPELAVEICLSSRSYDLGPKLALYRSAGVPEYLAIVLEEERIEWRILETERYRLMKPHRDGTLRSRIFPGLWLDTAAYWRSDRAALLATLERGIAAAASK